MSTTPPDVSFYESLIDTSPIVVFRLAGDGTVLHISPNCRRLFGWDPDEVLRAGWSWQEHVHPADVDAMVDAFANVVREKEGAGTALFRLARADGERRWTTARIRTDPSQPGLLLGFFVDVHQRVVAAEDRDRMVSDLRESELFLTSVVENIPNMVFVKDAEELRFVRFNRAGEDLVGRPREDLLGKSDHDLFPAEQADAFVAADRAVLGGGELLDVPEEEIDTVARGRRTLHTRKIPILDEHGTPRYLLGISEDITERRRADAALRSAKEEAERANEAKNEFLSRMSHELRTPLNSVLGFAQLLELDELEVHQDEAVHQILKAGRHLVDLIDEVLDISRIESGTMALSLEPVALDSIVAECLDLVRPQAQERAIELRNEDGGRRHVHADRQRLRQVLLNLLSNAVKFNRHGGTITVRCVHRDHEVEVRVGDTGPGIRAELIDRLFTPFERLEADEAGVEGTGLGLALSRRLVEAMGGRIGVQSQVGEGTVVSFVLPVGAEEVAADEQRERAVQPMPAGETTATVLHVEDNLANLHLVEEVFARRPSVRLLSAQQASRGLERARQHVPDLILLDVHLPDLEGDVVLQRLKAEDTTEAIPVVVVSADATERQVRRLRELGAHDYLTKPLDIVQLLHLVDGVLDGRG